MRLVSIVISIVGRATALAGGVLIIAGPAYPDAAAPAASQPDASIQEIVVTATKVGATALSKTAVTAEVVTAEALKSRNITNAIDLQTQVPGLVSDVGTSTPKLAIRGVGTDQFGIGAENGVAVYIDGVLVGRSTALLSPYNDLEQVEVLMGPQGTSFGRNSTGGAINYITKKPVDGFGGNVDFQYGSFNRSRGGGVLNYGSDKFAVRVSGYYQRDDGYAHNLYTGQTSDGGTQYTIRGIVDFKPTDRLNFEYLFDYANDKENGPAEVIASPLATSLTVLAPTVYYPTSFSTPLPNPLAVNPNKGYRYTTDVNPYTATSLQTNALTANLDLDAVKIKSITAYQVPKDFLATDADVGPLNLLDVPAAVLNGRQFTQEIDLIAKIDKLQVVVGGYYLHDNGYGTQIIDAFITTPSGAVISRGSNQITKSYAGFGELHYAISDSVRVTGGLRYTKDDKTMVQYQNITLGAFSPAPGLVIPTTFDGSNSWSKLTYSAGIEGDLNDHTFAYAKVGSGFKAGGYNDGDLGNTFNPETITSYEVGLKGNILDKRVHYAVSTFYSDYKNIQVGVILPDAVSAIENAAAAKIFGFDFQGSAKLEYGFAVDASISVIPTAKYTNYQTPDPFGVTCGAPTVVCSLEGNRLSRAPKVSGNFGVNYAYDIGDGRTLTARAEVYHTSTIEYNAYAYQDSAQSAYTLLNAYLTADITRSLSIRFYGKNLANEFYLGGTIPNSTINSIVGYYGRPREFGADLTLKF